MDAKWDPVNPKYLLKITGFYDPYGFIKKHFFDMTFCKDFKDRARLMRLKGEDYKSNDELLQVFNGPNAKRYYVLVDSLMCFSRLNELQDKFTKLQLYLISKNLKEIMVSTGRSLYKGPMKVDGMSEYKARMKNAWKTTFDETGIDIDKYLDSLK